jgi:hypothetical protein
MDKEKIDSSYGNNHRYTELDLPQTYALDSNIIAVSGRYEGEMTFPSMSHSFLDLRIDIDRRYANSPIMNRISGDFYQVQSTTSPGLDIMATKRISEDKSNQKLKTPPLGTLSNWRVYLESWIVDAPILKWSTTEVEISGKVRFWKGHHPATDIHIVISRTSSALGPAEITFTETGGNIFKYSCIKRSDCFRDLVLEVDVTESVNAEPILPKFDTHWHTMRPPDLPRRVLTIEEAYRETGVLVTINPQHSIINDSAPNFATWSDAELHDAMETYFSQYGSIWPSWQMWCLLCGPYDKDSVMGVMFDAAAEFGGAGKAPERQGYAVFRKHWIFDNLRPGTPINQDNAYAMREYLYTYVHEAGHAFNLLHSWNKGRPNSMSFMNYPQNLPGGEEQFWSNFRFRFDDEELIHIRHGDRATVIMGGDPWGSGEHLESPTGSMAQSMGEQSIEFLIRSKDYFEFMEPIEIELRLRNLLNYPITLDATLNPEYGRVVIYIKSPNGRIIHYKPVIYKEAQPTLRILDPQDSSIQGSDRYSENAVLTYGKNGFYFSHTGEYLIRAVYEGLGNVIVTSNTLRLRIGRPMSSEEDNTAYNYFSRPVGMSLYLKGSESPFLSSGKELLENIVNTYPGTARGAKISYVLASSESRPFFRIENRNLKQTHKPNYEKALKITEHAIKFYSKEKKKELNISYHNLVRTRVNALVKLKRKKEAKHELSELRKNLEARGINEIISKSILKQEEDISEK